MYPRPAEMMSRQPGQSPTFLTPGRDHSNGRRRHLSPLPYHTRPSPLGRLWIPADGSLLRAETPSSLNSFATACTSLPPGDNKYLAGEAQELDLESSDGYDDYDDDQELTPRPPQRTWQPPAVTSPQRSQQTNMAERYPAQEARRFSFPMNDSLHNIMETNEQHAHDNDQDPDTSTGGVSAPGPLPEKPHDSFASGTTQWERDRPRHDSFATSIDKVEEGYAASFHSAPSFHLEDPADAAAVPREDSEARLVDPTDLDWDGDNDPDDPHNWGAVKRFYHCLVPSLFSFVVSYATSVYVSGYPEVSAEFSVSPTVAIFGGLSLYELGSGFGPMLGAPISETAGRRMVYMTSIPLFALFTMGAGLARNFATLCACRFFAGFFGSPALAIGGGTGADLFYPRNLAVANSIYLLAPFAGPTLGPVIGGYVVQYRSWRWTQWSIIFFAALFYIFSLGMQETYKKPILVKRKTRQGVQLRKEDPKAGLKLLFTVVLIRPTVMLFTEPIVTLFSFYNAFTFAVLYIFFTAYPAIFASTYGFPISSTGLTFLSFGVGFLLATATIILIDQRVYQRLHTTLATDRLAPEHRLYAAMLGSLGLPIGLFWFAWTARPDVHWLSPVAAAIPFAWGNLCVFTASCLYLMDVYGALNGASALAACGLLRYILGATFPLFGVQMFERLGTDWAGSLLAFVVVAMLPVPWAFYRWGPRVRARSRYRSDKAW